MRYILFAPVLLLAACGDHGGAGNAAAVDENAIRNAQRAESSASPDAKAAQAQVGAYFAHIAAGEFDEAHAMWDQDGAASGGTAQDLKRAYAEYARYEANAELPSHIETRAGIDYVIVAVTAKAVVKRTGVARDLQGLVYLRRPAAAAKVEPEPGAWKIWAVDVRRHH